MGDTPFVPTGEGGLVEIAFKASRYDPARTAMVPTYADIPSEALRGRVSEGTRYQVFCDDDVWKVRAKYPHRNNWTVLRGSMSGAEGKPRMRRVGIGRGGLLVHRLVALAIIGPPPTPERRLALHIDRREEDTEPDNGPGNLYWGTHPDNLADDVAKNGRALIGKRREIRGRVKDGDGDQWTLFARQDDAAEHLGVAQISISRAIGRSTGISSKKTGEKWIIEYVRMERVDPAERDIGMIVAPSATVPAPKDRRFVLRDGRTGEMKTTDFGDVPVGFAPYTNPYGYAMVAIGGVGKMLSRVMAERHMAAEIAEAERMNPGKKWAAGDFDVDHFDGDEGHNAIDNFRIVTKQDHNDKGARAVVEIDKETKLAVHGRRWKSVNEAVRRTELPYSSVYYSCTRGWEVGGEKREFMFEDDYARGGYGVDRVGRKRGRSGL